MTVTPLDTFPPELSSSTEQLYPHEFFERMHANAPVRWDSSRECWDVFGYDEVKQVANNDDHFSVEWAANPDFTEPDDWQPLIGRSMLHTDSPRYDGLRRIVDSWFKPDPIHSLRPSIEESARELLDQAIDGTTDTGEEVTFDLVDSFSYPLQCSQSYSVCHQRIVSSFVSG